MWMKCSETWFDVDVKYVHFTLNQMYSIYFIPVKILQIIFIYIRWTTSILQEARTSPQGQFKALQLAQLPNWEVMKTMQSERHSLSGHLSAMAEMMLSFMVSLISPFSRISKTSYLDCRHNSRKVAPKLLSLEIKRINSINVSSFLKVKLMDFLKEGSSTPLGTKLAEPEWWITLAYWTKSKPRLLNSKRK